MVPATMMALRAHARGGPEQLVFEQAPVPVPWPGEALVEVHAATTFAELTWTAGIAPPVIPRTRSPALSPGWVRTRAACRSGSRCRP